MDRDALLERVLLHRLQHLARVGRGGARRENGSLEGLDSRFDGAGFRFADRLQDDSVGLAAPEQFIELWQLPFIARDHQFAALIYGNVFTLAVLSKCPVPLARELGLEAVGGIIKA